MENFYAVFGGMKNVLQLVIEVVWIQGSFVQVGMFDTFTVFGLSKMHFKQ